HRAHGHHEQYEWQSKACSHRVSLPWCPVGTGFVRLPANYGGRRERRMDGVRGSGYTSSSSPVGTASAPAAFFIKYALMNGSMSPSSTRLTSPVCSLVRRSLTS